MKILIEESVLRQALEALYLRRNQGVSETYNQMAEDAITALRTALDAAEEVEPVTVIKDCGFGHLNGPDVPLYDHPAPAVPEGWQLVPKIRTPEMRKAFVSATEGNRWSDSGYIAMLSAVPTPPTNTETNWLENGTAPKYRPGKVEFIPDGSELREAARAVIENYDKGTIGSLRKAIDRLEKAL